MLKKVVLISGGAAVGKTAVLKNIIPLLQSKDLALSVCKIDCVATRDGSVYQNMGIPHVVGISGDICPDHFLVSNLPELYHWADEKQSDVLLQVFVTDVLPLRNRWQRAVYWTALPAVMHRRSLGQC